MNCSASEISEELLKCLKLSNLNYVISEKPFSVEIKIKKSFVKEFPAPQEGFQKQVKNLMQKIKPTPLHQLPSTKIPRKSLPVEPSSSRQNQYQNRDHPPNKPSHIIPKLPPMNLNPYFPNDTINYPSDHIKKEPSLPMEQKSNMLPDANLATTQLMENQLTNSDAKIPPPNLKLPRNTFPCLLTNSTIMNSQSIKPLKLQPPAPNSTASLADTQRTPPHRSSSSRRKSASPPTSPPGFPVPTSPSIFDEERFDTYKNFTLEEFLYLMKIADD